MTKAIVAKIDLGFVKFDGLMLPDGSYAIGASQVAKLIGFDNEHSSRDIKALLGRDFQFAKVVSELSPKPVNTLTIPELEQLLKVFAMNGNEQAQIILGLPQKKKISSRRLERNIQLRLQSSLGGKVEVRTLAGNIDLLTSDQIIEVKGVKEWKSALGQIIVYGKYYPSHQKRIHLFGETQTSYLELIRSHCSTSNVIVTHQT